ncbi:MAG: HDOD domain-containing protein, partial [Candidatus Rokubacteria bacterium]|nr:HDOD domain-containing protein [Candidatus Rokubacteria bacterium]
STPLEELHRLDSIPSLPAVVTELLQVIDDPMASAMDVAYILREDPPLTARVLRMANSVIYGSRTQIMSVPQAVMRLGMVEIKNLVMSLGVIRALARLGRKLDLFGFWQHSLTVALSSEAIARVLPREGHHDDDEGAFAAGLLHDIGRLVLDQFYPDAFDRAVTVMEKESIPLVVAERRELGIDHAEIGGLVAERWGLPDPITSAIAYHHRPDDLPPTMRRISTVIRVAELTCAGHSLGDGLEGLPPVEATAEWLALGLTAVQMKDVVEETIAGARKSALLIALSKRPPR